MTSVRVIEPLHAGSLRPRCSCLVRAVCRTAVASWVPVIAGAQTNDSALIDRGRSSAFVHESWTVQHGLPVNSINALLQSRDGYLWIATFDGLVRFDGVRFTLFNTANAQGLPSNRILGLLEARDGSLWIRTDQLQLVRLRDGQFTHFGSELGISRRVRAMYEDAHGTVWVGTDGGLGQIRDQRFVEIAAETIRDGVHAIVGDQEGTVWAGSSTGGLFRIEAGQARAVVAASGQASDAISVLFQDARGTLWVGTRSAIWRYRESVERIATPRQVLEFRSSPATGDVWILTQSAVFRHDGRQLVHVMDRSVDPFLAQRLVPDQEGRMLYTSGPELHREGVWIHTLPPPVSAQRSAETITAVVLDHEGSLWLGTVAAGLHRLKPSLFTVYSEPEGLSGRNVYSVYEDRAGDIWIGTIIAGTNRLSGGRVARLSATDGYPDASYSFLQDAEGRLWIGGAGGEGLRVCRPPALRCERAGPDAIASLNVLAIHEEPSGALWFGTNAGLFRNVDGTWTRLTGPDGAPTFPIRVFKPTADGALWMGTNGGGLARYHKGRFTHVTMSDGLPIDLIRSLHLDSDGWLWVGTEGRGLARLKPGDWADGQRGGRIVNYQTRDGLFDDVIHQILEDDFGRLWMSSNRGIFRVDRHELLEFAERRIVRINSTGYTERDGLRNREANGGSQAAGIRASDGRLWFATQDGVAVVDPARVERNLIPPRVAVEQVTAGGTPLRAGAAVLELGVNQRDLEIDYTALSFLAPANVRFRYRLESYDAEWVEAGSRRTAYYTQVPPGRYTFRVLASNNDGVWNEEGARLELQLMPRFHETVMFRLLSLLAIAGFVAAGFRWRVQKMRARTLELGRLVDDRTRELREHQLRLADQNAQLEQQTGQLQELDHAKSRFFANVSHEFRTPITLILGPLRDMAEGRNGALSDALRRQVDMMTRNGQRLLRLVNQVLDLARLESGTLTLNAEPGDLVALTRSVTRSFTPLAERRRIHLTFEIRAERLPAKLDDEHMEKVLLNLLSNAFKFTAPDGRVEVAVYEEEGSAAIEVRDTGIGIPPDQLPHIFERFYQADGSATRRHEGTGIGLSLARELAELHGGSITAASRPGEGSTFVVRLPLLPPEQALVVVGGEGIPLDARATPPAGLGPGAAVRDTPTDRAGEPPPSSGESAASSEDDAGDADRTTVLVVDDNADIRAYVRSVLEPGLRVLEAADGQDGLERAHAALPDLIIADLMMPRLDGFGLVRALRDDVLTDCIPTILLTARAGVHTEMQGFGAGADDYIAKPFHAGVLEARVAGLIASRRRLRERFRQEGPPPPAPATDAAPHSEFESRLRSLIEQNLTEPDFNPEALAAAAGVSYMHLYRRLAAELDASPSRFMRTVRVERAADLLRDGTGSITEVAYSVGFNSLSYFNRCFHERFGISPSAVKRSLA